MSARERCVLDVTSRRAWPTLRVRTAKIGNMASESRARRQSSSHIAMTVEIAIARLLTMLVAVSVTTRWMPPTSLLRRDWISPVRVSVKKRSGIRWR